MKTKAKTIFLILVLIAPPKETSFDNADLKKPKFSDMFCSNSVTSLRDKVKPNLNLPDTLGVTVYNAVPEQCWGDPGLTAFMFKLDIKNPYKHKIIAVSWDLLKKYPNGTQVKISGTGYDGIYTVRDKMNRRLKKKIDILVNTDMKLGRWYNVIIKKI